MRFELNVPREQSSAFEAAPMDQLWDLTVKKLSRAAFTSMLAMASSLVWAADETASPFGIVIGSTTCDQALPMVRGEYEPAGMNRFGWPAIRIKNAAALYQGGRRGVVVCTERDKPVMYLMLEADEGAAGAGIQRAHDELKRRYRWVSGSLENGRGIVAFEAGTTTIELTASADDTFRIEYMLPDVLARKRAAEPAQPAKSRL